MRPHKQRKHNQKIFIEMFSKDLETFAKNQGNHPAADHLLQSLKEHHNTSLGDILWEKTQETFQGLGVSLFPHPADFAKACGEVSRPYQKVKFQVGGVIHIKTLKELDDEGYRFFQFGKVTSNEHLEKAFHEAVEKNTQPTVQDTLDLYCKYIKAEHYSPRPFPKDEKRAWEEEAVKKFSASMSCLTLEKASTSFSFGWRVYVMHDSDFQRPLQKATFYLLQGIT